MSADNVELMRRAYEHFNAIGRTDPETIVAEGVEAELWARFDPEFELQQPEYLPDASVFHGTDGFREFLRTIADIWVEVRWEPKEFIDAGDAVVVATRLVGLARRGEAPFETDETTVWWFREGRIARAQVFRDHDQALVAAGLER